MPYPITPTTSNNGDIPNPGIQRSPDRFPDNFQNLQRPNRLRTDSCMSINTTYNNNPISQPMFLRNRQNSNVSISSSIYSEMPQPHLDNYNFTQQFDDELYSYYIAYAHQPNITPFDSRFPPSGVLSLVSKLFYENKLLPPSSSSTPLIQIDHRLDVSNDLLNESNIHLLLTILRLRLIHLCNVNSNNGNGNGNDSYMMDQLPISRTNSIVSAISVNDRVMPNFNSINMMSTDSIQLPIYNMSSNNNNYSSYNNNNMNTEEMINNQINSIHLNQTNPEFDENDDDNLQHLQPPPPVALQTATKRERPLLNLNMPTFLQKRSSFTSNQQSNSTPSARTPRGVRSSSITKAGPTYFNLTPTTNSNPNTFHNPTLNHITSPLDMMSPFEQSFPSPLAFSAPPQLPVTSTNITTPTTNTTPPPSSAAADSELYNATANRKRDSLRFKRGLN
ncbi:hypothetical protein DAPK24_034900 [Pichia kluyveri]|uniref:Uncharacterized protein n=1 Tax=Pichia kluyveri TaxID=36015 RepID=A0AAV5R5Z5_PICKL|nr:hypothetical protein DAPK24_034900 [Pichia kluyveri]